MRSAAARRAANGQGDLAERAALLLLRLKFYSILARRYNIRGGEIDIVARRGGMRRRSSPPRPGSRAVKSMQGRAS